MTKPPAPPPQSPSPFARRPELGRQLTSDHIDAHLAAFHAAGGVVEVLGNTPIHKPWHPTTRTPREQRDASPIGPEHSKDNA